MDTFIRTAHFILGIVAVLGAERMSREAERRWRKLLGRDVKGLRVAYRVPMTVVGIMLIVNALVWPVGR